MLSAIAGSRRSTLALVMNTKRKRNANAETAAGALARHRLALGALVVLFFIVTIVRLGGNARPTAIIECKVQ